MIPDNVRVFGVAEDGALEQIIRCAKDAKYAALMADGWEVIRRGWPDILAYKDGRIRLVEVKDGNGHLKLHQLRVAFILSGLGIDVEIWPGGDAQRQRDWRADEEWRGLRLARMKKTRRS